MGEAYIKKTGKIQKGKVGGYFCIVCTVLVGRFILLARRKMPQNRVLVLYMFSTEGFNVSHSTDKRFIKEMSSVLGATYTCKTNLISNQSHGYLAIHFAM